MTVKDFYENVHGDYQGALNLMMSDAFIERMLGKFLETNRHEDLLKFYEDKNFKGVFEIAHSLKGLTGNLSLKNLYDLIVPIVDATRTLPEGEVVDLDKEIKAFAQEFDFVLSQLKLLLS